MRKTAFLICVALLLPLLCVFASAETYGTATMKLTITHINESAYHEGAAIVYTKSNDGTIGPYGEFNWWYVASFEWSDASNCYVVVETSTEMNTSKGAIAIPENGYNFKVATEDYDLPFTVYRPFFVPVKPIEVNVGDEVRFEVKVRYPAFETSKKQAGNLIYNEMIKRRDFTVDSKDVPQIKISPVEMPINAGFDSESNVFTWRTYVEGEFEIVFSATDGILPIKELRVIIKVN